MLFDLEDECLNFDNHGKSSSLTILQILSAFDHFNFVSYE